MAANFGATQMEGAIAPAVQLQNPVEDNSGAILASSLGNAAEAVGSVFGNIVKGGQDAAKNTVLNRYRSELLDLANAAEQNLSPSAARMRARALYSRYAADNPNIVGDIDKVHSELTGANGLAHIVMEGNEAAKAALAVQSAAITSGWVADPSDPAQVEAGVTAYQTMQGEVIKAEALQRELSTLTASGGIIDESHRQRAVGAVRAMSSTGYTWVKSQIDAAKAQIDAGGDKASIVANTKQIISDQLAVYGTLAEGQDVAWMIDPLNQMVTSFEAYATGSVENTVYEAQINGIKAKQELALRGDPELGPLIMASELLGANAPAVLAKVTNATNNFLGKMVQPYDPESDTNHKPVDPIGAPDGDVKAGLDVLDNAITKWTAEPSPQLTQEIGTSLTNLLRGTHAYANSAAGPTDFRDVVQQFAKPSVAKFVEANGGIIPTAVADKARQVIQSQYQEVLLPLVRERWEGGSVQINNGGNNAALNAELAKSQGQKAINMPINQVVDAVWNGSRVEFRPKAGYENVPAIRGAAEGLNVGKDSIGDALNTLIRANAHMSGNTDYQAQWDNVLGDRLFGLEEAVEGSQTPADANPTDQATPLAQLPPLAASGALQYTEGGLPIDPDTGFIMDDNDERRPQGETPVSQSFTLGDFNGETEAAFVEQSSALASNPEPINPSMIGGEINLDSYLPSIRSAESGGNDSAKNPASTALGRYQFLTGTWNDLVKKYPNAGLTFDGRRNAAQQEIAIRLFTGENARFLQRNGIQTTNGNLYAAHFLGASDAAKVLRGNPSDPISAYISPKVINANKFLRGMTVAQFAAWAQRKGNG